MACGICVVQIQPRKHVLDHVQYLVVDFTYGSHPDKLVPNTWYLWYQVTQVSEQCLLGMVP